MSDLDRTDNPDQLGQTKPPLTAWVAVDPIAELEAGRLPWPPFRAVEAPPCGDRKDFPADATTDGVGRTFWCDRLRDHADEDEDEDEHHRSITDLHEGVTLRWLVLDGG